jgi:hypothetical protein
MISAKSEFEDLLNVVSEKRAQLMEGQDLIVPDKQRREELPKKAPGEVST